MYIYFLKFFIIIIFRNHFVTAHIIFFSHFEIKNLEIKDYQP